MAPRAHIVLSGVCFVVTLGVLLAYYRLSQGSCETSYSAWDSPYNKGPKTVNSAEGEKA